MLNFRHPHFFFIVFAQPCQPRSSELLIKRYIPRIVQRVQRLMMKNDIVKNLARPLNMTIGAAVPIAVTSADNQELHIPLSASNMLNLVDDLGITETQVPFEAKVIANLLRIVKGEHFDAADIDQRMGSKIIDLADYLDLPEFPTWLREISEKLQKNLFRIV